MGLVEVAAGEGNVWPIDAPAQSDGAQDLLEPPDAAEKLGSEADFLLKSLDEAFGAHADLFGDGGDVSRRGPGMKFPECKQDCRMPLQTACPLQEALLKYLELQVDGGRGEQLFAQAVGGRRSPYIVQRNLGILQFDRGHPDEREGSAGFEVDTDSGQLLDGIDYKIFRTGPRDEAPTSMMRELRRLPFIDVELIVPKIDDQFDGAIGKNAFKIVRAGLTLEVPEDFHEFGKRPGGGLFAVIGHTPILPVCLALVKIGRCHDRRNPLLPNGNRKYQRLRLKTILWF
jgi:hypothetical protein